MTKRFDSHAFVEAHGVVLVSAKGPVPNLADAIADETISGPWRAHAKAPLISEILAELAEHPDVLCFPLVNDKLTYVHRRCWPALVVLADRLGSTSLVAIREERRESGADCYVETPYPAWVPAETKRDAKTLSVTNAQRVLGDWSWSTASRASRERTRRAASPATLVILTLIALVGLTAMVSWLSSPARLRPSTLPAGGHVVRERLGDDGIYYLHISASESAFEDWARSLRLTEIVPTEQPGTRQWMGDRRERCLSVVVYMGEDYGLWSAACR